MPDDSFLDQEDDKGLCGLTRCYEHSGDCPMNRRLIHDTAFQAARRLVAVIAPCLREEEQLDAFREFYDVLREELERYEGHAQRLCDRLRPNAEPATRAPPDTSNHAG